jgi:predicted enzyme related to lactoylglutathione lyase
MNLNHVHLAGPDLPSLRAFYETWFGFRVKPVDGHDDGAFLVDEKGFLLALDAVPVPHVFPAWYHIGFCVDAPQPVRDLYARMKAAGSVKFARELTEFPGEATFFDCLDPAGTRIEVSWHGN